MKVLHVIAGDLSGGAAKGAYELHKGLKKLNIDSKIFTNVNNNSNCDTVTPTKKKVNVFNSLYRKIFYKLFSIMYPNKNKIIFSTGFFGVNITKQKNIQEYDIIHLHWINSDFINIKYLKKINKPMVWTIRDFWPMTGGCHYPMECKKYKTGCGSCNQLKSKKKNDLTKYILERKIKYFPNNIKIIGISNWIADCLRESILFKDKQVKVIFNNINTKEFFPIEKSLAKQKIGVTTNKKIILVGAQKLNDFYKGFDKYLEAIKILDQDKYYLCFFGKLDEKLIINCGFEYINFGFINNLSFLRNLYSAADVFVAPSIMESFGKTLAESMACETPVVCFNATGPKDIVSHKKNGYKAIPFDVKDLAKGIEWVLDAKNYRELCKLSRETVHKTFNTEIIAKKYITLYNDILR